MAWLLALLLFASLFCSQGQKTCGSANQRPVAAATAVVTDGAVDIELRAQLAIACQLSLPISVPVQLVALNGSSNAQIVAVRSLVPNQEYASGDTVLIGVDFSAPVTVTGGTPTLQLSTGCHHSDCVTAEVQTFACTASRGAFAISLQGETIPNVNATTRPEVLRDLLQTFSGVTAVEVVYQNSEGLPHVCTDSGNTVTVRFVQTDSARWLTNGNVPEMTFDYLNAPIDARTLHSWGDGSRLWFGYKNARASEPLRAEQDLTLHGNQSASVGKAMIGDTALSGVVLSPTATEVRTNIALAITTHSFIYSIKCLSDRSLMLIYAIALVAMHCGSQIVKGVKQDDGYAVYINGSGTALHTFKYTVVAGDNTGHLEYTSSSALQAHSAVYVAADITLPQPWGVQSYSSNTGKSLAASSNIVISTDAPTIVSVTSPDPNRSYGSGEVIRIDVTFTQSITINTTLGVPRIQLETGIIDSYAEYLNEPAPATLRFAYTVASGDSSSDLDVLSVYAFDSGGAAIYRLSATPTTLVNLLLPSPGAVGSLSYNSDITVRPSTVNALDVDTTTVDGNYGTGEQILIHVQFGWWDDEITPIQLLGGTGTGVGLLMDTGVLAFDIWAATTGNASVSSNVYICILILLL
jgi:hypothetical protein